MNILILGDANSVFVRDFCAHVLDKEGNNICILSYTNTGKYAEFYSEMGIKEIYIKPYIEAAPPLHYTNIFKVMLQIKKEIKQVLPFDAPADVIHVHYVQPSTLMYMFMIWLAAKKRILTFWGSDILRAEEANRKLLRPFLYMASAIVFMIPKQHEFFCDLYGDRFDKKTHIIDFGNSLLDLIDEVRQKYSRMECKKYFGRGASTDKITIHVGYNKDEEQQHMKILKSICLLPSCLIEKIQIIFPWGYGSSLHEDTYIKKIKVLLDEKGIDYIFVKDFLQGEKLAGFRMSCDIFIYGQTTDAMSDSVLEYLYAGSLFLCPNWLRGNYSLIDKYTAQTMHYMQFTDLCDILCEIVSNRECVFTNQIESELQETIYQNKSWETLSSKWRECYE